MCRADELRNDIENLEFTRKYCFGNLAELEDLGLTHTMQYKSLKRNIDVINHNIKRLESELDKIDINEFVALCNSAV